MEVLKRLEDKINALVAHRNQLMGDLGRTEGLLKEREDEIRRLRKDLEGARSRAAALDEERNEVGAQIESILNQLVEQLEAQK